MHQQSAISIRLVEEELWKEFYPNTEMILTKKGRIVFPKLEYVVDGLNEHDEYTYQLRMDRVDKNKYKFDHGEWNISGEGEPRNSEKVVTYPEPAKAGKLWNGTVVSFARVKITNNPSETRADHIILQSMHKYIPVLTIIRRRNQLNHDSGMYPSTSMTGHLMAGYTEDRQDIRFDFTEFIAVTAYQNTEIRELKVKHNKYASAFRKGKNMKRARSESVEDRESNEMMSRMFAKMAYQPWIHSPYGYIPPMYPSTSVHLMSQPAHMAYSNQMTEMKTKEPFGVHNSNQNENEQRKSEPFGVDPNLHNKNVDVLPDATQHFNYNPAAPHMTIPYHHSYYAAAYNGWGAHQFAMLPQDSENTPPNPYDTTPPASTPAYYSPDSSYHSSNTSNSH